MALIINRCSCVKEEMDMLTFLSICLFFAFIYVVASVAAFALKLTWGIGKLLGKMVIFVILLPVAVLSLAFKLAGFLIPVIILGALITLIMSRY
jgi:hypothetical protein